MAATETTKSHQGLFLISHLLTEIAGVVFTLEFPLTGKSGVLISRVWCADVLKPLHNKAERYLGFNFTVNLTFGMSMWDDYCDMGYIWICKPLDYGRSLESETKPSCLYLKSS